MLPPAPRPLTLEEFIPLVGRKFLADCQPAPVELQLFEASPLIDRGATERPPFILIFYTPPEVLLLSGSYTMQCGSFGPDQIHISDMIPPKGAAAGYYYQAVFN